MKWIATAVTVLGLTLSVPTAADAKKTIVYVHNRDYDGSIYAFELTKNGDLISIAGSPFPLVDNVPIDANVCGGNCQTMAYSKKRKTLYTGGPSGVSGWTVSKDGALTLVPGSPFSPGAGSSFLGTGVVEVGKRVFVYSASFDDGQVYAWEAGSDGSLTELAGSPFVSGTGADGLVTSKKLVFVANEGNFEVIPNVLSTISSYVVAKDGTLTPAPGSPFTPVDVDFIWNTTPDAKGKLLYADDGGNGVRVFEVDKKTARLTEVSGSPFAAQGDGTGVLVTKKFAYDVRFDEADDALLPFFTGKKGSLEQTGIVINSPIGIMTFASDKNGKHMIFAGIEGVLSARIGGDGKKQGALEGLDSEISLVATNPNAVVMITR